MWLIADYHGSGPGNVNGRRTFYERQGRRMLRCLPQARPALNKALYKRWISTYPHLLVVDASVLPGAVVAQPTMTIVAQAIKAVDHPLATVP